MEKTELEKLGLKSLSSVLTAKEEAGVTHVVDESNPISARRVLFMLFMLVKSPPTYTEPVPLSANEVIVLSPVAVNELSSVPSEARSAIWL